MSQTTRLRQLLARRAQLLTKLHSENRTRQIELNAWNEVQKRFLANPYASINMSSDEVTNAKEFFVSRAFFKVPLETPQRRRWRFRLKEKYSRLTTEEKKLVRADFLKSIAQREILNAHRLALHVYPEVLFTDKNYAVLARKAGVKQFKPKGNVTKAQEKKLATAKWNKMSFAKRRTYFTACEKLHRESRRFIMNLESKQKAK